MCRTRTLLAVLTTASLVGISAVAANAQDTIRIGISQPLSGANGDYFKRETVEPIILAIEEINARGGLLGRPVEYVAEDNQMNPATAQAVARKLVNINKVTMISTSVSPLALATLPVATENRVIMMTISEHPKIIESPWGFRSTPSAESWGIVQARHSYSVLGARAVAVLAEKNDAIRLTTDAFKREFEKLGGKVIGIEVFSPGDENLKAQLTKLRGSSFDLLNIGSTGPRAYGLALKQSAELGQKPKYVMGRDMIIDPQVIQIAGDLVQGVYYTAMEIDPVWIEKFKKRFGHEPGGFGARTYDGTMIYLAAVQKAGTSDPVKIRDTLARMTDYKGILGKWGYNGNGDATMTPVVKQRK